MNDEAARRHLKARRQRGTPGAPPRVVPLERAECLRLLRSVTLGRVVFTAVVANEADAIDPGTHLGWSVVATG